MKRLLFVLCLIIGAALPSEAQTIRATQFVFGQAAITASRRVLTGSGSPESTITAPIGSVYLRTDGGSVTTAYLKESGTGNTGWIAVASTSGTLAQFAATTSAQLSGILTNEIAGTGGLALFGNQAVSSDSSPTFNVLTLSGAAVLPDDVRQTFNPGTNAAGLNVGSIAGDPVTPTNGDLWYDSTANELTARINAANVSLGAGGSGIPTDTTVITQTACASCSAEQALSGLSSGIMRVATTTGVITSLTDSAGIAANISDETGTGAIVFGTAPTFTTSLTTPLVIFNTAAAVTRQNTNDGSDNGRVLLSGGGGADTSRGALVDLNGNESALLAGGLILRQGNISGSAIQLLTGGGSVAVAVANAGAVTFPLAPAGAAGDTDACLNATTNELTDAGASTCIVSSLRFKDVIAPLDTGLAEVLRLHPFSYSLKNDPLKIPQIGLSAEEMNEVEPRLVFYEQDGPDKGKPRGILYEQSVALLTNAIKQLTACVASDNPKQCLGDIEAGSGTRHRSWLRKLLPW